jgi:tripartite-type tricarboxylate transporter receptor subunit TctC
MTRAATRAGSTMRHLAAGLVAMAGLACIGDAALAADARPYPSQPVRLVAASSAGGTMDAIARMIGDRLEEKLGQPVLIENRPGASGNIASEFVARAPPDGYTILVAPVTIAILPSTHGAKAVDPVRAFAPIIKLATQPILIVANRAIGVDTLDELIARARREPGRIACASTGIGTTPHLASALLWTRASVDLLHVPYANPAELVKDIVAGEVPVAFLFLGTAEPFLRSGQLKALAFTGATRIDAFPNVPTVAESGFPGYELTSWYGLLAPAGTPKEIVVRLHREVAGILQLPDVRQRLVRMGTEPAATTPDEFAAEIRASVARWPAIIGAAGIRPQ